MVILKHLSTYKVASSSLFFDIKNYNDLEKNIKKYGRNAANQFKRKTEEWQNTYNDAVGEAFEVYAEFFTKKYGTKSNPLLAILLVEDTSQDKYQAGYDFRYQDFQNNPARLQVKFRGNPVDSFKMKDLSTFISMCDGEGIPSERRILFTNLKDNLKTDGVFHYSYKYARNQMRVIDNTSQKSFIKRDSTFWKDFKKSLKNILKKRKVPNLPPNRDYQTKDLKIIINQIKKAVQK